MTGVPALRFVVNDREGDTLAFTAGAPDDVYAGVVSILPRDGAEGREVGLTLDQLDALSAMAGVTVQLLRAQAISELFGGRPE